MSADFDRAVRALAESIDKSLAETPLSVVFMGPRLDEDSAAARLRLQLMEAARVYGVSIPPEHPTLVKTASVRLGAGHQLTAFEAHLVKTCDLVVLIPASAGSLCELGLFAASPEFCQKMIIFVSNKFPKWGSYVADGPLTAAKHSNAEVVNLAYEDIDEAWSIVKSRIERIRVAISTARLLGEG